MRGEPSRAEQKLVRLSQARKAAEGELSLEVAILGDGRGTLEYDKRLELQARLGQHRFVSRITLPEDLQDAHPDATVNEVELSAIGQADVVLCLEAPSHPPLGLHTEAFGYFDGSEPDKWYLCRPADGEDAPADAPMVTGLASDAFKLIETFDYDPEEWGTCGRITRACERRINIMAHRELHRRARRSRGWRRWWGRLFTIG